MPTYKTMEAAIRAGKKRYPTKWFRVYQYIGTDVYFTFHATVPAKHVIELTYIWGTAMQVAEVSKHNRKWCVYEPTGRTINDETND